MKPNRVVSLFLVVCMACLMAGTALADTTEMTIWSGLRANVESLENNRFTDYYESLTGIHVNWITYVDEISTQFNLSLASGDYPDMYISANFSTTQMQQAIDAGAIVPIEDYLEEYAPNYYALLELDPELKAQMTAPDGHIYSFPRYLGFDGYSVPQKLWVYGPWLEASGLAMPTTIDELKELLIYFRDHDMNGNGDAADEVPMMGSTLILQQATDPMVPVISTFEVITNNWLTADADGHVSIMANTDAYRAGLRYAASLYAEGLCSEETYTQDLNTFRTINSVSDSSQQLVGVAAGPDFARFVLASNPTRYEDWVSIPPLVKDESSKPQTLFSETNYFMKSLITTACKDVVAAVQWLDRGLEPELQIMSSYGYEDEHWVRVGESDDTGIQFKLTDVSLYKEGASTQNETWSIDWWELPTYQGVLYTPFTQVYDEGTDAYNQHTKENAANQAYLAISVPSGMPYGNIWSADIDLAEELSELSTNINPYIKQSYTEFILGIRDVNDDAVWQEYLDTLDAMALTKYLDVCSEYYFGK